jgi:hypothetical protein
MNPDLVLLGVAAGGGFLIQGREALGREATARRGNLGRGADLDAEVVQGAGLVTAKLAYPGRRFTGPAPSSRE